MARDTAAARLTRYVADQLANGSWAVGVKLPSERELGARFDLSRAVVRRVLARYLDEGVLRR